ncbi:hypothetical protein HYS31_03350 [Candidatus Woesearchaeota archaeon]|nr:hypothetical protein [Candidatus Woesearchaeota archaeon]
MHEQIKKDILAVFIGIAEILKSREDSDTAQIKELSNHTIHNASIFQDEDSISAAILIYSLSKIMERDQKGLDYRKLSGMLNSCISSLKKDDDSGFRKSVKSIFSFIRTTDSRLKMFVHEVINQARIKKGCKLCQHGISVARASEVLGISRWELMNYLGKTTSIDRFREPISISSRLKSVRGMFS